MIRDFLPWAAFEPALPLLLVDLDEQAGLHVVLRHVGEALAALAGRKVGLVVDDVVADPQRARARRVRKAFRIVDGDLEHGSVG